MNRLERHWYDNTPLTAALYPLSLLFRAGVAARRALYRAGLLRAVRLPVPVVVVGNITVGGTGKTPLVAWLAAFLREQGFNPGIVSRGYGGTNRTPFAVTAASDPALCGDEAVMLARRCGGTPVWIGVRRAAAAQALLAAHPDCDVIVSDDGLQHYALARDVEVVVIDGALGLGNNFLLPAGPLREPPERLQGMDAIVVNVSESATVGLRAAGPAAFAMTLEGREFENLLNPQHRVGPDYFAGLAVHAIAAIGNPNRFFEHLKRLGLSFTAHPFPDHHAYTAADFSFAAEGCIVMTEKDAVKCRHIADERFWTLPVTADVDPAFGDLILRKLGKRARGS